MRKRQLITDDQRKEMLRTALENLALLQLSDSNPTWDKALSAVLDPTGAPLAYQTVWRWLQEPWGKEILDEHRKRTAHSGDDLLMRKFQRALGYQVAIACGDIGEPKDAVAAFKALKPFYEAAGLLNGGTEAARPASVQVLIQQFAGTVAVREQGQIIDAEVKVLPPAS
jgi:hypothetical protein